MPDDDQFELFGGVGDEVSEKPEVVSCVPKQKTEVESIELDTDKSVEHRPAIHDKRREMTQALSDCMHNGIESFYTVPLPQRLLAVYAFPLEEQDSWMAIHQTENYMIQTGVCEGSHEKVPMVMTLRDFEYFVALYCLIRNAPIPDGEVQFTQRHIGYIMAGFPEIEGSIANSTYGCGKASLEFGKALEKAHGRHLHYVEPAGPSSSNPGHSHCLPLLNYASHDVHGLPGRNKGKIYSDVTAGTAFKTLNINSKDQLFDLKMYFGARRQVSRAIILKLMPRIMAGDYNSKRHQLKVLGSGLLEQMGAKRSSYRDQSRTRETLAGCVEELNGLEGSLGTRIRMRMHTDSRKRVWVHAYMEKTERNREAEEAKLRNSKTYKLWVDYGGKDETFIDKIMKGRKARVKYEDSDHERIEKIGLNCYSMTAYLTTVKRLIGRAEFHKALDEFRVSVLSGETSLTQPALSGFLKTAVQVVAARS